MLNHLQFLIQTDAQAKEGFIIVCVIFVFLIIAGIWVKIDDSNKKDELLDKL